MIWRALPSSEQPFSVSTTPSEAEVDALALKQAALSQPGNDGHPVSGSYTLFSTLYATRAAGIENIQRIQTLAEVWREQGQSRLPPSERKQSAAKPYRSGPRSQ